MATTVRRGTPIAVMATRSARARPPSPHSLRNAVAVAPRSPRAAASASNYSASRYSSFMSELDAVLQSAARLQRLVPDAVLVGGSAAAYHARHRDSYDHDHVVRDLEQRFGAVLDALESDPEWVFNRSTPGKVILGELGGIEAGVRQMIRTVPLEVEDVSLPSGQVIRVPTAEEALRIKAWLIIRRNQVRDYLDVAALSGEFGIDWAATILRNIDAFYADVNTGPDSVASQVLRQLSEPRPKDSRVTMQLPGYKGLRAPWTDWDRVVQQCRAIADAM
ncbi:hypothetical protein [Mycobacterium sp. 141]|uniref:hypothetical protein n=1 Tax=Mycobacterium sp. 141 TaxID=1120797 RepID=UPI001E35FEBE|nr:hypothetical protein [Mycobacterium sp. 141]